MAATLPDGSFYTAKEVAGFFRVSYMTIVRMIERGDLPALRIGSSTRGAYRIPAAAVADLIGPAAAQAGDSEVPAQRTG